MAPITDISFGETLMTAFRLCARHTNSMTNRQKPPGIMSHLFIFSPFILIPNRLGQNAKRSLSDDDDVAGDGVDDSFKQQQFFSLPDADRWPLEELFPFKRLSSPTARSDCNSSSSSASSSSLPSSESPMLLTCLIMRRYCSEYHTSPISFWFISLTLGISWISS
jgi:hypothetical protein